MKRAPAPASLLLALALAAPAAAAGAQAPEPAPIGPAPAAPSDVYVSPVPSIQSSLGRYGDPGGLRAFLDTHGIDYNFTYIGEALGNPTGGVKRGATFEGRLDGQLDIDTEKLLGLKNGAVHAQAFQIHGRGLTGNNLNDLFTVSGLEAYPDTRLYELWYEHKLANGHLFVRFGQLAADTEFFVSQSASVLLNASFGWPASFANNLPNGGPAYPLATPGIRIRATPNDQLTLRAAVFNGDPVGPFRPGVNSPIATLRDVGGVGFRLRDAPLVIGEGEYVYNQEKDAKGLPGTVKAGFVRHFGAFAGFDVPPDVSVTYRGNDGIYGILDQTIYRKPGTEDQGAALFLRATYDPGDRNLIDFYADAGIAYRGLIPDRPDDTAGIGAGYAHVSRSVATQDLLGGAAPLVRDYQALVEATYQISVSPGVAVQPEFQYIFRPGARGVADPRDGRPIRDAAVFGLRTLLHY